VINENVSAKMTPVIVLAKFIAQNLLLCLIICNEAFLLKVVVLPCFSILSVTIQSIPLCAVLDQKSVQKNFPYQVPLKSEYER
jgi:hypothetical protein